MTREEAEKNLGNEVRGSDGSCWYRGVLIALGHWAVIRGIREEDGVSSYAWYVTVDSVVLTSAPKTVPVFQDTSAHPHHCPRCGRAAYVGFIRVEHADGVDCGRI